MEIWQERVFWPAVPNRQNFQLVWAKLSCLAHPTTRPSSSKISTVLTGSTLHLPILANPSGYTIRRLHSENVSNSLVCVSLLFAHTGVSQFVSMQSLVWVQLKRERGISSGRKKLRKCVNDASVLENRLNRVHNMRIVIEAKKGVWTGWSLKANLMGEVFVEGAISQEKWPATIKGALTREHFCLILVEYFVEYFV